jgi:hypothetical protein
VKRPYQTKERDVKRAILAYLKVHRIFHWSNNSGAFRAKHGTKERFVRFGSVGSPDIIVIHKGHCLGIECKGPEGFQSQSQVEFEHEFTKAGGLYAVARSIEDVHRLLEEAEARSSC